MTIIDKNTLCISDEHRLFLSQYIADAMGYKGDKLQMSAILISLAIAEYKKMAEDVEL